MNPISMQNKLFQDSMSVSGQTLSNYSTYSGSGSGSGSSTMSPPQTLPVQGNHTSMNRMHMQDPKTMKNYKPNELFIGNLSYFCEEKDLFELFDQYGNVEDIRIIKNDSGTRSLMFGFVTMSTVHEAREMEKLLNNHLLMGRRIRVAISERRYDFKPPANDGIQMHVNFCSFFNFSEELIRPTEAFLRKFFVQFGTILDITVKEYAVYHEQNMQEGYGFVCFETEDAIMRAISFCQNVVVHGITLRCTITHHHNPHSRKNNKKMSPTAAAAAAMSAVSMRDPNKWAGVSSHNSLPWSTGHGHSSSHNTSSLSALNPHLPMPTNLIMNNFIPGHTSGTSPRISMQFSSNDSNSMGSSMESISDENSRQSSYGFAQFTKQSIELPGAW